MLETLQRRKQDLKLASKMLGGLVETERPLITHLIVTRKCNLDCGYCFEYDKVSKPIDLEILKERLRHLKRLNSVMVTFTGGEALLHPDIVKLIQYCTNLGMFPILNTNGYLLTKEIIEGLNKASLVGLQMSIDNVEPDDVTKKSLRVLLPKLKLLQKHANFRVRVNTVLGTGNPEEAIEVAQTVTDLGFQAKCSLVRDGKGALIPLEDETYDAFEKIRKMGRWVPSYLSEDFQIPLAKTGQVDWKCRAGARYFTICEKGIVHYCESSWNDPGIRIEDYTKDDMYRAFHTPKSCASKCAVAYAHQASRIDSLRTQKNPRHKIKKQYWMHANNETFNC